MFVRYLNNYRNIPSLSWVLLLLTLIDALGAGLGFFIALYFKTYLNFSVIVIGQILSSFGFGTIIGGWFGGKMIDKISPSLTNVLSLLLSSLCFFLLALFKTADQLMIILFLMGIAGTSFNASSSVLILKMAEHSEQLRLKLLNLKSVFSNLGLVISATLLTTYAHHDFYYIFIAMAVLLFIAALYQYKINPAYPFNAQSLVTANAQESTSLSNKLFYATLSTVFVVGLVISQHKIAYPLFVNRCFTSTTVASLIFILNPLIIVFFQPAIFSTVQKLNKITLMGLGAIILCTGMLVLTLPQYLSVFMLSVVLYSLGEIIFVPLSQLLCYQSLNAASKGKAIGLWRATFAASNMIGPYVGGVIYDIIGPKTVWILCGALGIIAMLITFYLLFDKDLRMYYRSCK